MVVDKDALVRDYWHRGHWKLALIRNGSLEDSTSLACLKRLLQGISPGNEDLDTPVWRWERKGDFSVKSTYRFLIDRGLRLTHKKLNWETKCPLKVHIFMWLVLMIPSLCGIIFREEAGRAPVVPCVTWHLRMGTTSYWLVHTPSRSRKKVWPYLESISTCRSH